MELCTNIDIKNCIELLVLGDMYQASTLRIKALGFVSQNMDRLKWVQEDFDFTPTTIVWGDGDAAA